MGVHQSGNLSGLDSNDPGEGSKPHIKAEAREVRSRRQTSGPFRRWDLWICVSLRREMDGKKHKKKIHRE